MPFALIILLGLFCALSPDEAAHPLSMAVVLFSAPRRRDRADPTLRAFELLSKSPGAYLVTGPLGMVRAANQPAHDLARRCSASVAEGAQIRTVLCGDPDAEAKIYRAMRTAAEDGGAAAFFIIEEADPPFAIEAELSHAEDDEAVLWRLCEREIEPEPTDEAPPATPLLENAPVGYFSADRGGEILSMNATLAEWLGFDRDDAAETPPFSITDIFPDGARKLSPALSRVGERIADSAAMRTPDGGRRSVLVSQVLCETEEGAIGAATQSYVFPADLAGRGASGGASGSRLVRVLDDAPIAVAVITKGGVIVEANDMLVEMSGGAARVGEEVAVAVRLEDRRDVAERVRAIASGDSPLGPLDVKLTGDAGAQHESQFHAHRIDTERGEMLLAYLIDVSEKKKVEHQLAMVQKLQAVGQLAGGIAHDVNNVLTAIRGHCDLLMLRHHEGDPDFDHLNQIRAQTERAAEVISQLLAFSRRQTMKREITQLTDMLDDMSFMLKPLITERVSFNVRHARDLGLVKIDRNEFQRVVMNLTVNAVDAMSGGGGSLGVQTRNITPEQSVEYDYPIMKKGAYVLIEISDTGSGIPKENLQKIFEPFFTTKETGRGTGLGLSTVYGIIKQMNGYIFCDSELGKGATFRIFLPRYEGPPPSQEVITAKSKTVAPARDLSGTGRVLLVEDEDAVRSFAVRALELRGYVVMQAASGDEALEYVEGAPDSVDLIVSDVVMPNMTGPEMMRKVRQIRPEMRFIFISGYAEDAFREEMLEDEEDYLFLAKPFSLKDLAVKVKEALGG